MKTRDTKGQQITQMNLEEQLGPKNLTRRINQSINQSINESIS